MSADDEERHIFTLEEVEEATERTRAEREAQGLPLGLTDLTRLRPLAEALFKAIEDRAAPEDGANDDISSVEHG